MSHLGLINYQVSILCNSMTDNTIVDGNEYLRESRPNMYLNLKEFCKNSGHDSNMSIVYSMLVSLTIVRKV